VKEGLEGLEGLEGSEGQPTWTLFETSTLQFSDTGWSPGSFLSSPETEIIGGCDYNWGSGVGIARQWLEDGDVSTLAYVKPDQKLWPFCNHKSFQSEYSVIWF
jgi:hypothetical protein